MEIRALEKAAPDEKAWSAGMEVDRDAVCEQLVRVLASSPFRRSKGCSKLLEYIVNRTLQGETERLKERSLGVDVFGRVADYDTASDHVVRSTTGEVRKRLAQYYVELSQPGEIRIEIPPGGYVARFVMPAASDNEDLDTGEPSLTPRWRAWRLRPRLMAVIMALASIVVLSILAIGGGVRHSSGSTLNKFWRPVLQSPKPILLCIGAWIQSPSTSQAGGLPQANNGAAAGELLGVFRGSEKVYLDDAMALLKLASWLQQTEKPYRILPPARVTFADLQTSPAVLIGFNNYWTTSLADRLRFTIERAPGSEVKVLRDKKYPTRNDWSVNLSTPYNQPTMDYALVVRALDSKTGQIAVTAAGLSHFGTLAAGEFLTNPELMSKLDAFGPSGWEHKNVAIVLATEVIKGSPGLPKIVAADFW